VIYRYCDANGNQAPGSNPNGATRDIAGICNAGRNVFGMMPHPERATSNILGNEDGRKVFKSLVLSQVAELVG
jgi:phosphoribosylformylglycinamidine synthase